MSGEAARQFVDTNVLLYAYSLSPDSKHNRAISLISALWNSGNGCLSIQVLQEFYVGITGKVPRPLDGKVAVQIVSDLSQWTTHAPGVDDVLGAIDIHQQSGIAFWDAMIIRSAARLGCEVVWSEDLNTGQTYDGVCVRNPFAI